MTHKLSRDQERTWFVDQLSLHPSDYLLTLPSRFTGVLDMQALRHALTDIITRHEVLRTSVTMVDDELTGVVRPAEWFRLAEEDLADPADLEAALQSEATRPMNLAEELPIRGKLLRLGPDDHVLCLTLHHVVADDWSCGVLYDELAACYTAFRAGTPAPPPPLARQYRDVAAKLDARRDEPAMAGKMTHWRATLAGVYPFELPADYPRPSVRAGRGAGHAAFTLPPATTAQLASLGRRHTATMPMVLIAACQALFHRYTGATDITTGTTYACRDDPETDELIGLFVNMLPLRVDLSGRPTFRQLLQRVRDVALDAYDHADVPFDRLVDELAPDRDAARTPLFQILLNFRSGRRRPLKLPGLTVTELPLPYAGAKYDLCISFDDGPGGVQCGVNWDTALYDRRTVDRVMAYLRRLLLHVAAQPDTPVGDVPLLTVGERLDVQRLCTRGRVDFPVACLHELFAEQVAITPHAESVVGGDQTLSYAELNAQANGMARLLQAAGVGPDVPVGILLDRSVEMVVALLGVLKAGGAFVPIEPDLPAARISAMLAQARPPVCIVRTDLAPLVSLAGCVPITAADPDDDQPAVVVWPDHLCAVYYTSGSTGQPKGVACTHAGWVSRMRWMQHRHGLRPGETVLQKTTLSFDDAAVEVLWPLLVGGRVALLPPGLHGDPRAIIDAAVRYRAVHLQFVPSVLELFLDVLTDEDVASLGRLRSVLSSGEALQPVLVRRFFEKFGDRVELDNTWGATEVSIDSTCHPCRPEDATGSGPVSLGQPIDNNEVYVLDQQLRPLPPGVPGELCIAGAGLARGYLNDPARTAAAFVPHPWRAGERVYRTGDRGRLQADGSLEFLGRQDDQVKIRGVRIELGEIEAALLAHEAIAEAAVVAWQAAAGDKRLAAYVTLAAGTSVTVPGLDDFLAVRLPVYALPSAIMVLAELPRLASGKPDRRALPPPEPSSARRAAHVPARTSTEQVLAEIWAEVLGLPEIGVHDGFFAAGGHSLLVTRAINRMRQAFGTQIPLSLLFEYPTVASAAVRVEKLVFDEIEAMTEDEARQLAEERAQ